MKKIMLILMLAFSLSGAYAEEKQKCHTEITEHENLGLIILTIPFKVVAAFSHLPRCLIDHFPTNE